MQQPYIDKAISKRSFNEPKNQNQATTHLERNAKNLVNLFSQLKTHYTENE